MVTFPSQPCSLPRDLFQIKYGSMTKKKKKRYKGDIRDYYISKLWRYGGGETEKMRSCSNKKRKYRQTNLWLK